MTGDPDFGQYLLDNLHVDPDFRGIGVGKHLLRAVLKQAAQLSPGGCLYLWVSEDNDGGRRFYSREGGTEDQTRIETPAPGVDVLERRVWWYLPS